MKNNEIRKLWEEFIEKYNELFKSIKEKWIEKKELVEKYIIENKKVPSRKSKDKNIKQLSEWISHQQRNYKNKKKIMKNNEIRKLWEEFIEKYKKLFKNNEENWNENLNKLEKYIIKNKKLPSTNNKDKDIKSLGNWLLYQKQKIKKNIMKNDEIRRLWEEFIEKYSVYIN
jgi:polyhydroxyalkanoate synthesis regulator protein